MGLEPAPITGPDDLLSYLPRFYENCTNTQLTDSSGSHAANGSSQVGRYVEDVVGTSVCTY